jgi:hypothetical protein
MTRGIALGGADLIAAPTNWPYEPRPDGEGPSEGRHGTRARRSSLEPRRNVLKMVAMNLFTIAIVTITWIAVGFSLAFGPDAGYGLIGNLHYAGLGNMSGLWPGTHIPKLDFMAFQMMFAIITPALIRRRWGQKDQALRRCLRRDGHPWHRRAHRNAPGGGSSRSTASTPRD